jgi:hypothetical protein
MVIENLPEAKVDCVSYSRGKDEGNIVMQKKELNKKFMNTLTAGKVIQLIGCPSPVFIRVSPVFSKFWNFTLFLKISK